MNHNRSLLEINKLFQLEKGDNFKIEGSKADL